MQTGYIGETRPAFSERAEGNTEGRPAPCTTQPARISRGFLDGDGSICFQLVRRKDYVYGFQIRASVCLYQSTRHRAGLEWLKQQLGCGYIRDRAGSMSDYTIVGWSAVKRVLELVQPFVIFKREQVDRALDIMSRFDAKLTPSEFLETAQVVDAFATLNYSKRKHINSSCVEAFLNGKGLLVPVTTEAFRAEIVGDCRPSKRAANLPRRSHASSRKRDEDIVCAPSNRGTYTRETVRSLSAVGVGSLMGAVPSTRGPGWTDLRCSGCRANGSAA